MISMQLFLFVLCMVGHAIYAGIETGIVSIHKLRLRHFVREGVAGTRLLQAFRDNPDRLLGTTLVGTNICLVVKSVVAASLADKALGGWGATASAIFVTVITLVGCEYLPKAWFQSRPIPRSRPFAGFLRLSEVVFQPVSSSVVWVTRWMFRGRSRAFSDSAPFVTREDLKVLARDSERGGVLSPRERVMIHRVFELSGKRAAEIMVPRSEMIVVRSDMKVTEFYEVARRSNLTRYPVYDESRDAFAGIINVFFVLSAGDITMDRTVAEFARSSLFVPEGMPVDDILPRMRRSRQPMCLVKDAEDKVTGLITTEDILEEIVGEL